MKSMRVHPVQTNDLREDGSFRVLHGRSNPQQASSPSIHAVRNRQRRVSEGLRQQTYSSKLQRKKTVNVNDPAVMARTNLMVIDVNNVIKRLKRYSDASMMLAMVGLVLEIVAREIQFNIEGAQLIVDILRTLVSVSTLLLLFCIYRYYHHTFVFLKLNREYLKTTGWMNQQIIGFVIELVICSIHAPAFVNYTTDISVDDISILQEGPVYLSNGWTIIMFARIYLIIRFIKNRYYSGGVRILGLWFNFRVSDRFTIRHLLHARPLVTLLPVVLIMMLSSTYGILISEREVPGRVFNLRTSMYLVNITMLGVGYGDLYPITAFGRGVAIVLALMAQLLAAVLVASVAKSLTLYPYEMRMVEFLGNREAQKELQRSSSKLIVRLWKAYMAEKKHCSTIKRHIRNYRALQSMYDFHVTSQLAKNSEKRLASGQLFRGMLERVQETLENSFNVMLEMDPNFDPTLAPEASEESISKIVKTVDRRARKIQHGLQKELRPQWNHVWKSMKKVGKMSTLSQAIFMKKLGHELQETELQQKAEQQATLSEKLKKRVGRKKFADVVSRQMSFGSVVLASIAKDNVKRLVTLPPLSAVVENSEDDTHTSLPAVVENSEDDTVLNNTPIAVTNAAVNESENTPDEKPDLQKMIQKIMLRLECLEKLARQKEEMKRSD